MQGDGHAVAGLVGCVELRMAHPLNLFQGCHNLQILGYFLYCIHSPLPGQAFSLGCHGLCIHGFQFHAVGGYGSDAESDLGFHCKVQILAFANLLAAFDGGGTYRVHSIVHTEPSCHGLDTGQVFGGHLVSPGIGSAPDGYGVVGFSV